MNLLNELKNVVIGTPICVGLLGFFVGSAYFLTKHPFIFIVLVVLVAGWGMGNVIEVFRK